VTLALAGLPLKARIDPYGPPRHLRVNVRVSTHLSFVAVLVVYPVLRGQSPLVYYGSYFPVGARPFEFVYGLAAIILCFALLHLAWLASGTVLFARQRDRRPLGERLGRTLLGALPLALIEELVFRSVVLADLMLSFEGHLPVAIALGAVIAAGAHYVRPVRTHWLMFGQLAVSLLFSVAFVRTHALWLPIGLHAGGYLAAQSVRPFSRYDGPAWLVGMKVFPYAGVPGVAAMLLLTYNIYRTFGP
jgi:membrane protease YdiL (CAAX protease family)